MGLTMMMRRLAFLALLASATPALAQSTPPPSMTRTEFIPICVETMRGTGTPAQYEMACLCIWEQGMMWIPLADVREIVVSNYRKHRGLAVRLDEVPEARRGLVEEAVRGVNKISTVCMAGAALGKINADGSLNDRGAASPRPR
jgi:hypothetical protein